MLEDKDKEVWTVDPNQPARTYVDTQPAKPPTTTRQEDKTLEGQRRVNIIWEITQAIIAIVITFAVVVVGVHVGFSSNSTTPIPTILSNAFFLIVGFYFSRTNHSAIGGTGRKANEDEKYEGR